ncbi:hypothetical protein [Erwinia pyri]|uniref:hypothetical protein n=1 Tax=Erwinia pyri TaxID=3062598 RepID=UPI002740CE4D|nr:hypothetical protein [Erwinia sp. DE2]
MINLIKRFFKRMFKSLVSMYGPAILTILFAMAQGVLFPDSPIWFVPLFFVFVMVVFYRYVKW